MSTRPSPGEDRTPGCRRAGPHRRPRAHHRHDAGKDTGGGCGTAEAHSGPVGWDNPLRRLLARPDEDDGQTARLLLASALAAVKAAEAGNG